MGKHIASCFRNRYLQRAIASKQLDSTALIAIASEQAFPVELIPEGLCDFLELELLKIIQQAKFIPRQEKRISCNSFKSLKKLKNGEIQAYLTDEFFSEFFDSLATGIDYSAYEQIFQKLLN